MVNPGAAFWHQALNDSDPGSSVPTLDAARTPLSDALQRHNALWRHQRRRHDKPIKAGQEE